MYIVEMPVVGEIPRSCVLTPKFTLPVSEIRDPSMGVYHNADGPILYIIGIQYSQLTVRGDRSVNDILNPMSALWFCKHLIHHEHVKSEGVALCYATENEDID